ncbi:UDP-3-O-(3-hydroxymyristoyl)glucosamine N-acyltransferase [Wohlfahrtiimonas chitiniclastica]|uniref:UDP-3-O-acylglucosamine N-acyltransferase n=1 Tax=Wohlfahrtiimonas chitiniclastica TaxID=400946 RepID=A0AB35BWD4_9GAMM|nr:UDP-3-O-(3-hydroxymyristoyl)glucosamine N-acyltransferase [Wohlfahrtiimonas chitiniclastica]MBS7824006.1 UDP-3-O-(3-hydroxymyristoyl)glucosamine N-acyltransferase [Wohlfahrtiimonas chitiniclastica]MBS7839624.1 UDP-3-O-(3-hydroxymyristoyl)glucosamine N-acyltransferase [Wohlfahrtiimonas chitiniclastica]
MLLSEIYDYVAHHINDLELKGDQNCQITRLATIQHAKAGEIAFINNVKYRQFLETTEASVVILAPDLAEHYQGNALATKNPYLAWAYVSHLFDTRQTNLMRTIHPSAVIDETATIGENVYIGANVVIEAGVQIGDDSVIKAGSVIEENVVLGKGCFLYPNVTICYGCILGDRVTLHSGVVIGAEGFGFAPGPTGYVKIAQVGRVILSDDVDIGANSCIDRGAIEDTVIGKGTKIDNHVQLGHNGIVGEHTVISGFTGIAGSATIGNRVVIGGGVGINGHIKLHDGVMVTGDTMVTHSLIEPGVYSSGMPVTDNRSWRKNVVQLQNIDKLYRRVKALEKKIDFEE